MTPESVAADDLFRERVLRAREMTPGQRLLRGLELFDEACEVAICAIRGQHPEWTEEPCQTELTRRIEIGRRLDDAGLYRPIEAES